MRLGVAAEVLAVGVSVLLAGCASSWEPAASGRPVSAQAAAPIDLAADQADDALPKLTDQSGLGDYLAYAGLNNPGLEAAFHRWKAALERVPQVRALPDPRFTYRYFISEVETRVGAQRQAFALAQTFPWLGKLELRGHAALEAAEAERQRYQAGKLRLFYRVKDAYYEYYHLSRAIAIVRQNIRLLRNVEQVMRTRYKAGAARHPDVVRLQVELGKLDDRLRALVGLREPMVARLNAAMNRPSAAPLPWPKGIADQQVSVTDQELLVWMEQANPEVRALDYEIGRAKHKVELAKKAYFPDVTVGVDYVDVADPTGGMRPGDAGKDAVAVMASVNLPIWWDKLSAGVREARHRHLAAVHDKTEAVNRLSAELKLAAYRFRDADRRIGLYRDTLLPKATESLKTTNAAFRAGRASYTDLIDAERILLAFALAYERALADKAQRLAELEMLAGKEITARGSATTRPAVPKDRQPQDSKEKGG